MGRAPVFPLLQPVLGDFAIVGAVPANEERDVAAGGIKRERAGIRAGPRLDVVEGGGGESVKMEAEFRDAVAAIAIPRTSGVG